MHIPMHIPVAAFALALVALVVGAAPALADETCNSPRSEEHTSELQSQR